ncbi:MAG: haloacid dehalogenase [Micavibrio aeruginosavorus]|nr:haloacid dehalogenase [Micavibrio aeruginosavorus]
MVKDLGGIQGILWDLDNTLYAANQRIYDSFNLAVARAALECGLDMPLDQAQRMAWESYERHRYSGLIFVEEYNIPFADLHKAIDPFLDHTMVERCGITESLFAQTACDHVLITHSGRPWTLNVLSRIGLRPWFPDDRIFAFENYDFESKARSRRPFDMALGVINRNPQDVLMVEDTVENLRVPHEMGMTTVFLHHGSKPRDLPDYVDHQCDNARVLLETIYSSASG